MVGKLLGQPLMRGISFGHDQQSGRFLVDPVDNSRADHATNPRQLPAAMMQQGIDQRAIKISGSGMDHKPGRLVDYDQVFVFEHDGQRNILGDCLGGRSGRDGNGKCGAGSRFQAGLGSDVAV